VAVRRPPTVHGVGRAVALVTGASRGVGEATAIALAADGLDLVITARTTDGTSTYLGTHLDDPAAGMQQVGSLDATAEQCRALGAGVVTVEMDLTDRASVDRAADLALDAFGRVDVVISSARYQGPGLDDAALGVPVDLVQRILTANALHPLVLFQRLIPPMVERGEGVVVHLTSVGATQDPTEPGAWGVGSAMGRAAAHRMIGVLHAEVGGAGVRCYNVNPGRLPSDVHLPPTDPPGWEPAADVPDFAAATIAWLVAGSPEARALAGTEVMARRRDHRPTA
jgi:NAD(P)-dependent dehydrogenase (short-subunit alcohol dehydrogenase family)